MLCNLANLAPASSHTLNYLQEAASETAAPERFSFNTPGAEDAADAETPVLTPQGALRICTAGGHFIYPRLAYVPAWYGAITADVPCLRFACPHSYTAQLCSAVELCCIITLMACLGAVGTIAYCPSILISCMQASDS